MLREGEGLDAFDTFLWKTQQIIVVSRFCLKCNIRLFPKQSEGSLQAGGNGENLCQVLSNSQHNP